MQKKCKIAKIRSKNAFFSLKIGLALGRKIVVFCHKKIGKIIKPHFFRQKRAWPYAAFAKKSAKNRQKVAQNAPKRAKNAKKTHFLRLGIGRVIGNSTFWDAQKVEFVLRVLRKRAIFGEGQTPGPKCLAVL